MSSTRKQQIRPRFVDLAEFDDEQFKPADPDAPGASGQGEGNAFNWPAAATVVRKPPPSIGSSKGKKLDENAELQPSSPQPARTKVVRIAPDSDNQVREIPSSSQPTSRFAARRAEQASATASGSSSTGFSFGPSSQPSQRQPEGDDQLPHRFTLDFEEQGHAGDENEPQITIPSGPPLIGNISERPKGSRSNLKSKPKSGSRFLASREIDRAIAESKARKEQTPGTGFPTSQRDFIEPVLPPRRGTEFNAQRWTDDVTSTPAPTAESDTQALASKAASTATDAATDEEEWLDEDGRVMSAFRKARLLRQGLQPPAMRKKGSTSAPDTRQVSSRDPTRDPGGGADPESITALLASVSEENDKKIASMDPEAIQDELKSLESLFGKDVLEALQSRKKTGTSLKDVESQQIDVGQDTHRPKQKGLTPVTPSPAPDEDEGPDAIRRRYFPAEPEGPNPALEWMMSSSGRAAKSSSNLSEKLSKTWSNEPRFDFEGKIFGDTTDSDSTYLAGLHNHGDDQESPGYTTSELLHLAKSRVAAQRQLALNVLGRICDRYPSKLGADPKQQLSDAATKHLDANNGSVRARAILTAWWLVEDRNFTVRSAALRCLNSVIRSGPSGPSPEPGCQQLTDWTQVSSNSRKKRRVNSKMSFEEIVKTDWPSLLMEGGFVQACLTRTQVLVSSRWDAQTLLEIMWRIASCSAKRTDEVLGGQDSAMRELVLSLGLKTTWPPPSPSQSERVSSTAQPEQPDSIFALPSLHAVKLLHLGVLSNRELAKAMVLEGTIDHLLRFVVLAPWTIEKDATESGRRKEDEDLVLRAYEIYSVCLDIYISLARYGFYSAVAGRTWSTWQDAGAWVKSLLNDSVWDGKLTSTKFGVAARLLDLFRAWTVCAQDPHQLLDHHDITWTQVRDLIDLSLDILPLQQADSRLPLDPVKVAALDRISGAAFGHIRAWIQCVNSKEAVLLSDYQTRIPDLVERALQQARAGINESIHVTRDTVPLFADRCRAMTSAFLLVQSIQKLMGLTLQQVANLEVDCIDLALDYFCNDSVDYSCWSAPNSSRWTTLWQLFDTGSSRATGLVGWRRFIIEFLLVVTETRSRPLNRTMILPLLTTPYKPLIHQAIVKTCLDKGNERIEKVLRPFLDECIFGGIATGPDVLPASVQIEVDWKDLVHVDTLFYREEEYDSAAVPEQVPDVEPGAKEEGEAAEEEEEETDPLTEAPLWRCPASGIPLRPDWPLLALDDLLHSAHTAVLNRPDNLDPGWQANEEEIVRSSLQLANGVFDCWSTGVLPESSFVPVLIGVAKVFMLEKDQPDLFVHREQARSTGALTGRDLFREPAISGALSELLSKLDRYLDDDKPSLADDRVAPFDDWIQKTMGGDTSFYQFYSDLVGLYDSISFGDENFGHLLLLLASILPLDFRRLLWINYPDALRTIRKEADSSTRWWRFVSEEDPAMFERYEQVLIERKNEPGSLVCQIAKHHLANRSREGKKEDLVS